MADVLHTNKPQYFHLLWDEEIERLQGVLQLIQTHHTEVLDRWYQRRPIRTQICLLDIIDNGGLFFSTRQLVC